MAATTTLWQDGVDLLTPCIVQVATPEGRGTGFLLYCTPNSSLRVIATAAHVVDHAHYWELPIRITHHQSGKQVLLHHADRAIHLDERSDTAAIVFNAAELPFPSTAPALWPVEANLKIGNEVGWMGFPAVASKRLCFFSGRVSCYQPNERSYLIDGVAINGVSGGPTFFPTEQEDGSGYYPLVGVVSAYIPNRSTGASLPGLSVVQDVSPFIELVKHFKSVDEAKEDEEKPTEPPPAPSTGGVLS